MEALLENGFGTFLAKKVQETNVEKSIRETQNPCTFIGDCKGFLRIDGDRNTRLAIALGC
ncbi:MAG: hypothetical protein EWV55_10135 [Microcystis viridis Mv_BB_P_19951000_S69]|uniref:Uncharacterized protein n=1 Tax=Microcystis viridis Mv_BB_P_19951000_S68D TaxID=2486270 RepID=A0A552IA14_MICVR|nr:MAG: hypothetical protein EWV47_17980 [Microcystis viridis Mv_BB_P_19951000_S68]TRU74919.1 MAG: hypothetical protein EWV55_10135 [Microcystis viridis Mv_BB_P_19951000_S69]TRU80324.1 MAG: hypothetical protein EWV77_00530 [Microcystis viridis Mv_BB_P_19951000_S68D]TRU87404.1 MAG: hypothetical protein EWV46_08110 [Microcystis viridis Mv_BB_P_19951000_S69D]